MSTLGLPGCLVDFALPPRPQQDGGLDAEADASGARCGDGVRDPGEVCDGSDLGGASCEALIGEPGGTPGCHTDCTYDLSGCDACGDGLIQGSESCDDGNRDAGDGCAPDCQVEDGWRCDAGPCEPVCGDGIVVGDEPCDDRNAETGDGCTPDCQVEPFHACWGSPSTCVCVLYVNQATVPDPARTGASWGAALERPQDALTLLPTLGDCEIWVAEGTYSIYEGDQSDTLALPSGLALYGGFSGDEVRRDARAPEVHITTLDGAGAVQGQSVRSVVTILAADGVTLDGFVVTGAEQHDDPAGAVLLDDSQNAVIRSCRIEGNTSRKGAGIHIRNQSSAQVDQCVIQGNVASDNGGGIYVNGSTLILSETRVAFNSTEKDAGGLYTTGGSSSVTATRSWFLSNVAANRGGGVRIGGTARFESCVFAQNSTISATGGAVQASGGSTRVSLVSCTLWNNRGDAPGRVLAASYAHLSVENSILWDSTYNDGFAALSNGGTLVLSYSDVGDPTLLSSSFQGVISQDPDLSAPVNGDFHLLAGSPCIDAADGDTAPALDLEGHPRVDIPDTLNTGTGVISWADQGAFEYQP